MHGSTKWRDSKLAKREDLRAPSLGRFRLGDINSGSCVGRTCVGEGGFTCQNRVGSHYSMWYTSVLITVPTNTVQIPSGHTSVSVLISFLMVSLQRRCKPLKARGSLCVPLAWNVKQFFVSPTPCIYLLWHNWWMMNWKKKLGRKWPWSIRENIPALTGGTEHTTKKS
jgi:hypothetical protein